MAISAIGTGLPGLGSQITTGSQTFLRSMDRYSELVGGAVLDGTKSGDAFNGTDAHVISNGTILGKVTATGKYAPTIIALTSAAAASSATTVTVSAAAAAEIVRRKGASGTLSLVAPPTAGGTVAVLTLAYSAVNTSTGAITCTALSAAAAAGSAIVDTDGTQTPIGFLNDDFGQRMTDYAGTRGDQPVSRVVISGDINVPGVLALASADASVIAYYRTLLASNGRTFTFSTDY